MHLFLAVIQMRKELRQKPIERGNFPVRREMTVLYRQLLLVVCDLATSLAGLPVPLNLHI
jgi:hypothetical protein